MSDGIKVEMVVCGNCLTPVSEGGVPTGHEPDACHRKSDAQRVRVYEVAGWTTADNAAPRARLELSGHAPDCPTKGVHVSECGWCRPWEPEDGPFHDTLLGWFDRPGGTRINCSCSAGPIHPPSVHGRFCPFKGPVLPKGRGRAWLNGGEKPRDAREDMADLLRRMRELVGEMARLLEASK